jgi:mRNA-degrading endonuclease RelE of RelBE toxin-antitoxin system
MREFEIKQGLHKILARLSKKDKAAFEAVMNKIQEVLNSGDVEHYKNLRYNLKDSKRAHIGHFVLVFCYDKSKDFISFEDYDHHDNVYQRNK